jgi:hypothetical protein
LNNFLIKLFELILREKTELKKSQFGTKKHTNSETFSITSKQSKRDILAPKDRDGEKLFSIIIEELEADVIKHA